jgi:hypothetical protein
MDARRALAFRRALERAWRGATRVAAGLADAGHGVRRGGAGAVAAQPIAPTQNGVAGDATEIADVDSSSIDADEGELGAAEDYLPGDYLCWHGCSRTPRRNLRPAPAVPTDAGGST